MYNDDLAYIQATAFENPARGATPEILQRLKDADIPVRHVLDVGCGSGPLTAALTAAGYRTTAIDQSADLLHIARTAAPAARFIQGSIYDVELPFCDAVLAVGEPLTYHAPATDADRLVRSFFERVSLALPAGGLLIFDVIELGKPPLAGRFWSAGKDWAVMVETTEDQHTRHLVRDIQTFRQTGDLYRRGHEIHSVRLFDTSALCDQLRLFGFSVETAQSYGAHTLGPRRRAFFATRRSPLP